MGTAILILSLLCTSAKKESRESDGSCLLSCHAYPAQNVASTCSPSVEWTEMGTSLTLALVSCALLGLRHGFDYDHLAAITDITSVQRGWREGMRLGLLYALGHACTVAVLGGAVVVFRLALPVPLDAIGERVVGLTLLALTAYILLSFFRRSGSAAHLHSRSRLALLLTGAQYLRWRMRRWSDPALPRPEAFRFQYGQSTVFLVGILHGLGAETPSQLVLFLLAAHLGGTSRGILGLLCFIGGLLAMNTIMTASASGVFARSVHRPGVQSCLTLLTAAYSFAMGLVFVLGASGRLPPLAR